jgi:hypothetical protein
VIAVNRSGFRAWLAAAFIVGGLIGAGLVFYTMNFELEGLKAEVEALRSSKSQLDSRVEELTEKLEQKDARLEQLEDTVEQLASELKLYREVPHGYYPSEPNPSEKTQPELNRFLNNEFQLPRSYERGVFDCSEAAAYLEYQLERNGFKAQIATGPSPCGGPEYHAWVTVSLKNDVSVAIVSMAI